MVHRAAAKTATITISEVFRRIVQRTDDDTISRPAATLPVKIAQATSRHGPDGSEMNSAAAVPMASAAAVAAIRETGGLPGLML
ncbi:MAG: hypothetical protein ABGZ35_19735 [Planctomycetaceae bacterium]